MHFEVSKETNVEVGEMSASKCFVISPIGASGSEIREHADDVFDYIVKPACEAVGFSPIRADHDTRPGVITEQMYDSILGDQMLIGLLTYHNPNVFYEIAVAEAAARPIILMIEEGSAIPFDIKDRRVLFYNLKPRSLMEGTHRDALIQAIKDLQTASASEKRVVPFRPSLSPLGASESSIRVIHHTNKLAPEERVRVIDEAESFLDFRGIAFFSIPNKDQFLAAIKRAVDRGVKTRVLLMDPDNPALEYQLRDYSEGYLASIRSEVRMGAEMWADTIGSLESVKLQKSGIMTGLAQISEREAILTGYQIWQPTADSPCMILDNNEAFYTAEAGEFAYAWENLSGPVTLGKNES